LRSATLHLFPAYDDEVLPHVEHGAATSGLVRVRPHGESARRTLPGFASKDEPGRYVAADRAGSLRGQALTTIVAAVGLGVLSGGVFVPIGAGYVRSPFPQRFVLGLGVSAYLALCVLGTFGAAWPVAVLYAVILNTLALRDLTRAALAARIDGFVDRRAFLPSVAERVWIPRTSVLDARDEWHLTDGVPLTDGPWRTVFKLLTETSTDAPPLAPQPAT
jgi:hypothetical protein